MERHVKERLVGAAVLMAAAIILIPEMLSGPERPESVSAAVEQEGAFKTYTIDLDRSPGSQTAPAAVIEESAPPPEESPRDLPSAARLAQTANTPVAAPPENTSRAPQASPESRSVEPAKTAPAASRPSETPPPRAPAQARTPPPSPPAASTSANRAPNVAPKPAASGWAVQVGSFSNRATAERLTKEFSGSGHTAFVMPVQSGGNTLYRVRIGPFAQRAAADAVLPTIKKRVANAVVVAHP